MLLGSRGAPVASVQRAIMRTSPEKRTTSCENFKTAKQTFSAWRDNDNGASSRKASNQAVRSIERTPSINYCTIVLLKRGDVSTCSGSVWPNPHGKNTGYRNTERAHVSLSQKRRTTALVLPPKFRAKAAAASAPMVSAHHPLCRS
jgi:hypothetical protein